ncbi:transmembrane protein [Perilla frutescens var. hirtella]|uniref:Transmembrane protein n=1 Tax=Perilla frutescens var. hirtella TaxID=608512 RepID=A0AAD4PAM9_PERFH|nr:transmembrane protein [Perilla frutescens var. hirtella]
MVALLLFVIVLSPIIPTGDAARFTEVLARRPICPACLCCEPPPPGSCCRCCASSSPIVVQTNKGSP